MRILNGGPTVAPFPPDCQVMRSQVSVAKGVPDPGRLLKSIRTDVNAPALTPPGAKADSGIEALFTLSVLLVRYRLTSGEAPAMSNLRPA